VGRELVRLGFLRQTSDRFSVLELTPAGLDALKQRRHVTLTKPVSSPAPTAPRAGEITCDDELFERLRLLRKRLSDERGVPPYSVFSDVSLRQMARSYPASEREFASIVGVGQKKLSEFGTAFLAEIASHLLSHPRQMFAEESFIPSPPATQASALTSTVLRSLRLFQAGASVDQIAIGLELTRGTILGHLAAAIMAGQVVDLSQFFTPEQKREVAAVFDTLGLDSLKIVFESLGGKYDYDRLRLAQAALRIQRAKPHPI
jgi:ATP-dependent DNA helicase RecQ